jgi:hypothetical protein
MLAEILKDIDGRHWLMITDQSQGDQRLLEFAPAGSNGLQPEDIVFLTFIAPRVPLDPKTYAKMYVEGLKARGLNGDFTTEVLKKSPQEVCFTAEITGDALLPDTFGVYRVFGRPNTFATLGYEHRGAADRAKLASSSQLMQRIPADAVRAMSKSAKAPVQLRDQLPLLSNIKGDLGRLAAKHPNLAPAATDLIEHIDDVGNKEPLFRRFAEVLFILRTLIILGDGGWLLTPSGTDDSISGAEACAQFFRQIQSPPLFHFSLSVLARLLVTDPRRDPARIQRGMWIADYLYSLGDAVETRRAEEAILSLLFGANRIAVVTQTQDAIERSESLLNALRHAPLLVARLLARMARIPLIFDEKPDRAVSLERLGQTDMMTYMLDALVEWAEDTWLSHLKNQQTEGGEVSGADPSVEEMFAVFAACPPELEVEEAEPTTAPQTADDAYWGPDRAPFLLLRLFATHASMQAQSELLGFDYAKERESVLQWMSRIKHRRPYVCLLRSFRAMRRLWAENAFSPGDPDIYPLTTEPKLLTMESAFERALGARFTTLSVGGGYDILGMGRMNVNYAPSPAEEHSWKEVVQLTLDLAICILILPDTTAGVEWEIEEISRRGMIDRTILVMLPLSVDSSAASRWRSAKAVLEKPIGGLPDYQPEGAFVFFQSPAGKFGKLPFSALYDGQLAQLLLGKCVDRSPAANPA